MSKNCVGRREEINIIFLQQKGRSLSSALQLLLDVNWLLHSSDSNINIRYMNTNRNKMMLTVDNVYEVIINVVLTVKEFITWLYAQII